MTLPYIINVAIILAACLAFYKVLLRRETFYRFNRYLLILCLAFSFALPLVKVPYRFSFRTNTENPVQVQQPVTEQTPNPVNTVQPVTGTAEPLANTEPGTATTKTPVEKNTEEASISFTQVLNWMIALYWFGVIIFAACFIFQAGLLFYRALRYPVIRDGRFRIIEVTGDKAPCSFGNYIFINPEKYDWEVYNQILSHEKIHIQQRHTLDIILAEMVLIFQWFNPFAWVYRNEIESNLEFLTDDKLVTEQDVDKKSYQLSLVKVSAPHLPLSLTTNYNQSILKTRIAMMNKKRSSLHTAWKYFFLVPVLAFLACLLNDPMARAQNSKKQEENAGVKQHEMRTEGYWFAVIKGDKVNIRFSDEQMDDENDSRKGHSFGGTDFLLSELGTLPRGASGSFTISREAGKMEMTGRFEDNTGMGRYKFMADKAYVSYMNSELKSTLDEEDQVAFFMINIRKDYPQMLKKEGYSTFSKDDIIPLAALKVDQAYIHSMKEAGFKNISLEDLVPLKALGIDAAYVKEIRSAGYPDIHPEQLITFKAQGIDKDYIRKMKQYNSTHGKDSTDDDIDDIVSFKALNIDDNYINSFKAVGYANIPKDEMVSFKALGVTPEFIKAWQDAGFSHLKPEDIVGLKAQNISPDYMKSFTDIGYKGLEPEMLTAFKALGITPEWIAGFETVGYKHIDADQLTGLKAQNVTPDFIKGFSDLGFRGIDIEEFVGVKATGVTPQYVKDMRAKGFNYNELSKYITLKSLD